MKIPALQRRKAIKPLEQAVAAESLSAELLAAEQALAETPPAAEPERMEKGFKEQAYIWRTSAIVQMPVAALSIAVSLAMYFFADTVVEVHHKPEHGYHTGGQLNNSELINAATTVVNLVATYQPAIARRNFTSAQRFLIEPALSEFEETMMQKEAPKIEQTRRSQTFMVIPSGVRVERFPGADYAVVSVPGERTTWIANKKLVPEYMTYFVKLTATPQNLSNQYGLVASDLRLRKAGEAPAGEAAPDSSKRPATRQK